MLLNSWDQGTRRPEEAWAPLLCTQPPGLPGFWLQKRDSYCTAVALAMVLVPQTAVRPPAAPLSPLPGSGPHRLSPHSLLAAALCCSAQVLGPLCLSCSIHRPPPPGLAGLDSGVTSSEREEPPCITDLDCSSSWNLTVSGDDAAFPPCTCVLSASTLPPLNHHTHPHTPHTHCRDTDTHRHTCALP